MSAPSRPIGLALQRLREVGPTGLLPSAPWWLAALAVDTLGGGLATAAAAALRVMGDAALVSTLAGTESAGPVRGVEAVGVAIVYSLALALGVVAGGVGALWVMAAWGLWLPVVVLERRGLARSATLTRGRRAQVLATWLPMTVTMWLVPFVVSAFMRSSGSQLETAATLGQASLLLLHPVQTALAWTLYAQLVDDP